VLYAKVFVVTGAFCSVLWLVDKIDERFYPVVETRRSELLDAASSSMVCPRDQLTVSVEATRRARITGCDRAQVFAWSTQRGKIPQWKAIDPPCAFVVRGTASGPVVYCFP
jgi:hypothetical protein